jgi:hypothetical protein
MPSTKASGGGGLLFQSGIRSKFEENIETQIDDPNALICRNYLKINLNVGLVNVERQQELIIGLGRPSLAAGDFSTEIAEKVVALLKR